MEEIGTCFLWFIVRSYFVLTPLLYFSLSQQRDLDSGSRVKVCSLFPTDSAAFTAVSAVFVSMDPGVRISASFSRSLSSLLPSACHEHHFFFPEAC